jgi:hypothetical protein
MLSAMIWLKVIKNKFVKLNQLKDLTYRRTKNRDSKKRKIEKIEKERHRKKNREGWKRRKCRKEKKTKTQIYQKYVLFWTSSLKN